MIEYIEGTIIKIHSDSIVVLTAAGIGFNVFVTRNVFKEVNTIGHEIYLNTYMQVKEDGMTLYGFLDDAELDMFKSLISVSGVGPKYAISILSTLTVSDLAFAIISEDIKTISTAQGVGKKLAEKIIVELKDKIDTSAYSSDDSFDDAVQGYESGDDMLKDAAEALTSLGYSATQSYKAVRKVPADAYDNIEDLIKQALKRIG